MGGSPIEKAGGGDGVTPGLVLDYARALKVAIQPTPLGWYTLAASARRFWRYALAFYRGGRVGGVSMDSKGSARAARKRSIE